MLQDFILKGSFEFVRKPTIGPYSSPLEQKSRHILHRQGFQEPTVLPAWLPEYFLSGGKCVLTKKVSPNISFYVGIYRKNSCGSHKFAKPTIIHSFSTDKNGAFKHVKRSHVGFLSDVRSMIQVLQVHATNMTRLEENIQNKTQRKAKVIRAENKRIKVQKALARADAEAEKALDLEGSLDPEKLALRDCVAYEKGWAKITYNNTTMTTELKEKIRMDMQRFRKKSSEDRLQALARVKARHGIQ